MLFDSGATHSFISKACVEALRLHVHDLVCQLVVSTPAFGHVSTSLVCIRCSIEIIGRIFVVNLIYFSLEDLDEILRMDWLTVNNILIDCGQQKVMFRDVAGLELSSIQVVLKEINDGATWGTSGGRVCKCLSG